MFAAEPALEACRVTLAIEPLTPNIGAVITGVDLAQPLDEATFAAIEQAMLHHQVIFLRGQDLTEQQHRDFAARFGPLHIHPIYPRSETVPEIMLLDTALNDLRDNATWHSDISFTAKPSLGAVLLARQVPDLGGDTLWASASAAYDALPVEMQAFLGTLSATHDLSKTFPPARFGGDDGAAEKLEAAKRANPPVLHPVIRTHPVTGRKIIFVSEGFTTGIADLDMAFGERLLQMLYAHIARPEFTVRWKWRAGDVAIWDNRSTQHYATFDYGNARRVMNRATMVGDAVF